MILHHSATVKIKGNSYLLREKVKAGVWPGGEIEQKLTYEEE
jgi:hypothetical protein